MQKTRGIICRCAHDPVKMQIPLEQRSPTRGKTVHNIAWLFLAPGAWFD